jgi:hypothetical protein
MANLKHTPEGLREAFAHHLVYEVNMFRLTYLLLQLPAWSGGLANAIIESFCVHARNLIDFFSEKSATPGQSNNYTGAKHFSDGYTAWTKGGPSHDLCGRLNRQISHITYDRTSKDQEKIGPKERAELVELIERELKIFSGCLRKPYKEDWPFGEDAASGKSIVIGVSPYSATNQVGMIHSLGLQGDLYGMTGLPDPALVQGQQSKDK